MTHHVWGAIQVELTSPTNMSLESSGRTMQSANGKNDPKILLVKIFYLARPFFKMKAE